MDLWNLIMEGICNRWPIFAVAILVTILVALFPTAISTLIEIFLIAILSILGWIIRPIYKPFINILHRCQHRKQELAERKRLEHLRSQEQALFSANGEGQHEQVLLLFRQLRQTGFSDQNQEALCFLRAADSLSHTAGTGSDIDLAYRWADRSSLLDPAFDTQAASARNEIMETGHSLYAPLLDCYRAGLMQLEEGNFEKALSSFQESARLGCGYGAERTVSLLCDLARSAADCDEIAPWLELCRELDCHSPEDLTRSVSGRKLYFEALDDAAAGFYEHAIVKCFIGTRRGSHDCALLGCSLCIDKYDDAEHCREGIKMAETVVSKDPHRTDAQRMLNEAKERLAALNQHQ